MRLAEALKLRSDLNARLAELGTRLNSNAKVQEGEVPSEDPPGTSWPNWIPSWGSWRGW